MNILPASAVQLLSSMVMVSILFMVVAASESFAQTCNPPCTGGQVCYVSPPCPACDMVPPPPHCIDPAPEMSDYLAISYIVVAGCLIYFIRRQRYAAANENDPINPA